VAGEAAVRADDAVTGEDDRQRIPVHHGAHRPRRSRSTDLGGERAVGGRVAVLDPIELPEDAPVKLRRRTEVELEVEGMTAALEVLVQLPAHPVEGSGSKPPRQSARSETPTSNGPTGVSSRTSNATSSAPDAAAAARKRSS